MRDVPLRLKFRRRHGDIIWPYDLYDPDTKWCKKWGSDDIDLSEETLKRIQFEQIDSKRADWDKWW